MILMLLYITHPILNKTHQQMLLEFQAPLCYGLINENTDRLHNLAKNAKLAPRVFHFNYMCQRCDRSSFPKSKPPKYSS